VWDLIKDWAFSGFALIFFIVVLYSLVWVNTAKNATVAAFLAVFCSVMGSPERFKKLSFSFTGIETQARDVIQQAQITVDQLQKLAAVLAEGSLDELAFSGTKYPGISTREKFRIRDQVIERLQALGVKPDTILEAQHIWILLYCSILEGQIDEALVEAFPNTDLGFQVIRENGLPAPDALRKWVTSKGVNNPKVTERLDEYERVWTTGAIHNPDLIPSVPGSIPQSLPPRKRQ
jgi:hypothetical protein